MTVPITGALLVRWAILVPAVLITQTPIEPVLAALVPDLGRAIKLGMSAVALTAGVWFGRRSGSLPTGAASAYA